jgi:hypothetical protein
VSREHALTLPSGSAREPVRDEGRLYHLRGSEVDLLERVGRYRAVFVDDLKAEVDDVARAHTDLRSLERQGLIESRTATRLRDGAVADVLSVTHAGKSLLDHHRDNALDVGQVYHAGWVKPAEVWHDASLHRMVRQGEADLLKEGEHVRRVVLDDELKAKAYLALHEARHDGLGADDARAAVAATYDLHVDDGHFVFPDARLEIVDRDGVVGLTTSTSGSSRFVRRWDDGPPGRNARVSKGVWRGTDEEPVVPCGGLWTWCQGRDSQLKIPTRRRHPHDGLPAPELLKELTRLMVTPEDCAVSTQGDSDTSPGNGTSRQSRLRTRLNS